MNITIRDGAFRTIIECDGRDMARLYMDSNGISIGTQGSTTNNIPWPIWAAITEQAAEYRAKMES